MSAVLSFHGYGHHHERGAEIARHHPTAIELAPTDGRMIVPARQLVSALTNGTALVLLLEVEKPTDFTLRKTIKDRPRNYCSRSWLLTIPPRNVT